MEGFLDVDGPISTLCCISFRSLTEYFVRCLRGYYTRYDCSSADINPIGSISKKDLKRFISWARTEFCLPILEEFLTATPTAELEPIIRGETPEKDYVQADEIDMGMTYDDLSTFGICKSAEARPVRHVPEAGA